MIPVDALPLAALALVLWIEAGWANILMIRANFASDDPDFAIFDKPGPARIIGIVLWFAFWPAIMLAGVFMAWKVRP